MWGISRRAGSTAGARAALPRNGTGRSSGRSVRTDTPWRSVGSTSSRTSPIGRTTGTSIEWHGKTRSGPVGGRASPETTRTDGASWGPTIASEASSVRSRGGGNACDPTLRGTLEGDNRLGPIRARVTRLPRQFAERKRAVGRESNCRATDSSGDCQDLRFVSRHWSSGSPGYPRGLGVNHFGEHSIDRVAGSVPFPLRRISRLLTGGRPRQLIVIVKGYVSGGRGLCLWSG